MLQAIEDILFDLFVFFLALIAGAVLGVGSMLIAMFVLPPTEMPWGYTVGLAAILVFVGLMFLRHKYGIGRIDYYDPTVQNCSTIIKAEREALNDRRLLGHPESETW